MNQAQETSEADNNPADNSSNQNGGNMSKLKKTLIALGLLVLGGVITIGVLKLTPLGGKLLANNMPAATPAPNSTPTVNPTPSPSTSLTDNNNGLTNDPNKLQSRAHGDETIANVSSGLALSPLLDNVRRVKPEEVLRREHFLVNGQLPANINDFFIEMPQLTGNPGREGKVSYHYRLNHQTIIDSGLDPKVFNGLRFNHLHNKEQANLSNDLSQDEDYFIGTMNIVFTDDGEAVMEKPTGFRPGSPPLANRTTITFHGMPDAND